MKGPICLAETDTSIKVTGRIWFMWELGALERSVLISAEEWADQQLQRWSEL